MESPVRSIGPGVNRYFTGPIRCGDFRFQRTPSLLSSSRMPFAAKSLRMPSARAKLRVFDGASAEVKQGL